MKGFVAGLALLTLTTAQEPALDREWLTREQALAPGRHAAAIDEAFRSPHWTDRARALEVCRRILLAGGALPDPLAELPDRALDDPHGDVRALGLRCLRLAGTIQRPEGSARLAALAQDRRASVRLELARLLEAAPHEAAVLAELARDEDERVAQAATRALIGLVPGDEGATRVKLELLASATRERDDQRLLRIALAADVPGNERFLERAAAASPPGWSAAFGSIALARGGTVALDDPLLMPEGARRSTFLLAAARSGREDLARAWLGLLERDGDTARPGELAAAVVVCIGPRRALELAHELELPGSPTAELLFEVGRVSDDWTGLDVERCLSPAGDVATRHALVRALGLRAAGTDSAGGVLVRLLDDPDEAVRRSAFLSLADLEPIDAWVPALHRAWRPLDEARRAEALRRLPRGVPLSEFRADLLALGEHAGDGRGAALELLAGLRGDVEVRSVVERWLEQDRLRFDALAEDARAGTEQLLVGAVRALAAIDAADARPHGGGAVPALEAALRFAAERSEDLGKASAAALGRSPEGRTVLASILSREPSAIDRRARIEAAIAILRESEDLDVSAAVRVLEREGEHAGWDLRVRMLAALGLDAGAGSRAYLLAVAGDGAEDAEVRRAAIDALGEREEVGELCRLASETEDLELRLSAWRALAEVERPDSRARAAEFLEGVLVELESAAPDTGSFEHGVLRGELLARLAAMSVLSPAVERAWLRGPLASAAQDLRERRSHDGFEPVEPRVRWDSEHALAAALARAGRLGAVLERTEGWERVDGEVLASLGESVLADDPASARALLRAAVVGLAGLTRARSALFRARTRLAALAWSEGRWEDYLRLAERLLSDRRAGEVSDGSWIAVHGREDLALGLDPVRRLEASLPQARAWLARSRGEDAEARRTAAEARRCLGRSQEALREQLRLERALAAHADGGH